MDMSGAKDKVKNDKPKIRTAPKAVTLFLAGATIVIAASVTGFVFAYVRTIIDEQSHTIAERDKLFAHTLARSVDIYVTGSSRSIDRLALAVGRSEFATEAILPQIEDVLSARSEFFVIAVANLEGKVVSGLAPDATDDASKYLVGVTVADRDYFQEVLATRRPVVSDAIVSKVLSRPTIGIASPIFNQKKELIGVAVGGLRLDSLYKLADYAIGSEFAIPVVIDGVGGVLVHPDRELVEAGRVLAGFEPAKRALKGEDGFLDKFIDIDGVERSAAYAPISSIGWGVWIAQDTAQFTALRNKVFGATLPWAGMAILGVLALFAILTRIVYGPMKQLAKDARSLVERGDLDTKVVPRGQIRVREVEIFADSFNGLLGAVKKMRNDLEDANSAKSRFLTVATHAFRTPITVSSWTLDLMVADIGSYNAEQRSQIMQLLDADKRMQLGFANLFAALELQGGTGRADLQKGVLSESIRQAVERMSVLASSKSIKISSDPDGAFNSIFDDKKMGHILDVLLANAVFYNRKDGKVSISMKKNDDEAVIVVEDTGIGIPPNEMKHLFEPFFRGSLASKRYTDGTGLGLHIAKSYIELQGGTIEINSTEAEGTRVTLTLPLRPIVS